MELSEHTEQQMFVNAVSHFCDGLHLAVGCLGLECEHAEEGEEYHSCESSFSHDSCDSCGSRLGGDRHTAYALITDNLQAEPIEFSICVDCAMYHANGELPEQWT